MKDFIFNVSTKILFGRDQMDNLASEIKKYGSRVLLAYGGGSIKRNGLYDEVVEVGSGDYLSTQISSFLVSCCFF